MKKIKILRIIARLNIGGPAIHTILLTEGLNNERFESLLISGQVWGGEGDMVYYAHERGVRPYFISQLRREINLFNDLIAISKIYNLIKKESPDIIHTHTAKAGSLGRLAAIIYNFFRSRDKQVKIIHTFHGHVLSGYFNKLNTTIFILIEQFLAHFTTKIVTLSESLKNELINLHICNGNKIEIIPLGLELEKFSDAQFRNNPFVNIGIVGRLVPIKNHRLFLESAFNVIRENPHMILRFKVIGGGELRVELEEYTGKLGIGSQVDFLGWQDGLGKVYSDLDIVALTSSNEGTPVSLIEAMASGRAIVATDVGGVRDLLGSQNYTFRMTDTDFEVLERGIIVKPGDVLSFTRALNFALKNEELRKDMGENARNFAISRFTEDRLIKDMENLYSHILTCAS